MARATTSFAGPGFAGDQDRAVRARHCLEQLKQLLHRAAAAENSAELVPLFELRSKVRVFRREPPLLHRLLQHVHQLVELKRLGDEVRRASLDGVDGVFHRAEAGDDDGDDSRIPVPGRLDDPGPVDSRQPKVGDDDVKGELVEELEGPLAAVGLHDFESALGQTLGHQAPAGWPRRR